MIKIGDNNENEFLHRISKLYNEQLPQPKPVGSLPPLVKQMLVLPTLDGNFCKRKAGF